MVQITALSVVEWRRLYLLSHWLRHYISLGVESYHLLLHEPNGATTRVGALERLVSQKFGVSVSVDVLEGEYGAERTQVLLDDIRGSHEHDSDWILWADSDELHDYGGSFRTIVGSEIDYVAGTVVDRFASRGWLRRVHPDIPLEWQFPLACAYTRDHVRADAQRVMLTRPWVRLNRGQHHTAKEYHNGGSQLVRWPSLCKVHHFKWDNLLEERLQERLTPRWRALRSYWVESDYILRNVAREEDHRSYLELPESELGTIVTNPRDWVF